MHGTEVSRGTSAGFRVIVVLSYRQLVGGGDHFVAVGYRSCDHRLRLSITEVSFTVAMLRRRSVALSPVPDLVKPSFVIFDIRAL